MTQVHPESDGKQECDKRAFCAQHSVRATESFTEGSKEGSNEEPTDPPLHEMKRRVSNVPTLTLEQREKYRRFYKVLPVPVRQDIALDVPVFTKLRHYFVLQGGLFVGDSWVIDSEHTAVVVLDTSMVFLLTYTALVTPFEVPLISRFALNPPNFPPVIVLLTGSFSGHYLWCLVCHQSSCGLRIHCGYIKELLYCLQGSCPLNSTIALLQ